MTPVKRRSVYQGGKVVPEPTGHEQQTAESALSGVRRPGEPNFRPPFEHISDPSSLVPRFASVVLMLTWVEERSRLGNACHFSVSSFAE